MIPHARAQLTGVVCIGPDLPGQTACPSSAVALTGPSTAGPFTQIRFQVFIQVTDPMNGFDITLLANHLILVPVGIDLSGSILGAGPTVLAECLQGVLVAGSVCQASDTIDTLHLASVAAPGALPGGTTARGASGLLFTAIYNIMGSSAGITLGYQSNANDGLTNCTNTSVPGTCVNISNGTTTPVPETAQTATFTSTTTQAHLQLAPGSTALGNAFPGTAIPVQTFTTTDVNGYATWQFAGGVSSGDATVAYTVSITPPSTGATGITATLGGPNPQDFTGDPGPGSVSNTLTLGNAATSTAGLWTITVSGTYHYDPNCVAFSGCPGPASTLVESITYTVRIVDFNYNINGATASLVLPFWCPAVSQGSACPTGTPNGVATITVSPNGYTGTVTLANGTPAPVTTPPLAAALSTTSIAGASGTATDTVSNGLLRPTATTGQYTVAVTATGTLAANGAFPAQTKVKSVNLLVMP